MEERKFPPQRPIPQRPNFVGMQGEQSQTNNESQSENISSVKNEMPENKTLKSRENKKNEFKLSSQTRAFILYFFSFLCFAGAIACFVFLF